MDEQSLREEVMAELQRLAGKLEEAITLAASEVEAVFGLPPQLVVLHLEEGPVASPPLPQDIVGDFQLVEGVTTRRLVPSQYHGTPAGEVEERTAPKLIFKRPVRSVAEAVETGVKNALESVRSSLDWTTSTVEQLSEARRALAESSAEVKQLKKTNTEVTNQLANANARAEALHGAVEQLQHEDKAIKKLEHQVRLLRMEVGERRARELLGEEG